MSLQTFLLVGFLCFTLCFGGQYYLSGTGTSNSFCDSARPCRGFDDLTSKLGTSDSITVADGEYSGFGFGPAVGGTSTTPLTVTGSGANAVINGSASFNGNYVQVSGLHFQRGTTWCLRFGGNYTLVKDSFFTSCPFMSFYGAGAIDVTVINNVFRSGERAIVPVSLTGVTVRGNKAYDMTRFFSADYMTNGLIEKNEIYSSTCPGDYTISVFYKSVSVAVRNNLFVNQPIAIGFIGSVFTLANTGVTISYNTIVDNCISVSTISIYGSGFVGPYTIRNNIFISSRWNFIPYYVDNYTVPHIDPDYNLYSSTHYMTGWDFINNVMYNLSAWRALGKDTHSVLSDPTSLFYAPVGGLERSYYHLITSSAAYNKGQVLSGITDDLEGNARGSRADLGAFHYGLYSCTGTPAALSYTASSWSCTGAVHASTCSVTCQNLYAGTPSAVCEYGQWVVTGNCSPMNCTAQPANATGALPWSSCSLVHGKTCTTSCEAGMVGGVNATCQFGSWNVTGQCVPRNCDSQPWTITNVAPWNCSLLHGTVCSGSCVSGASGTPVANCSKGSWTVGGNCVANNCVGQPTAAPNANAWACSLVAGTTCTANCQSGFAGTVRTKCTLGSWETITGGCAPANCSAQPSSTQYANAFACPSLAHGYLCSTTCTSGSSGNPQANCSYGGWIKSGSCVPNNCSAQPTPDGQNANPWNCSLRHGDYCTAFCISGFTGYFSTNCQFGVWQTITGKCAPRNCSSQPWSVSRQAAPWACPLPSVNGTVCSSPCLDNTTLNSTCNLGTWDTVGTCGAAPCSTQPSPVTNALAWNCTLPASVTTRCYATCAAGFTGAPYTTCVDLGGGLGSWSGRSGVCKAEEPASSPSSSLGPVLGGVIGGVALISVSVGLFCYMRKNRRNQVAGQQKNLTLASTGTTGTTKSAAPAVTPSTAPKSTVPDPKGKTPASSAKKPSDAAAAVKAQAISSAGPAKKAPTSAPAPAHKQGNEFSSFINAFKPLFCA